MDPLLTLSGTALARKIRRREISSEKVVKTHIDHVRKVNPVLNAVVEERFDEAMEEARAADRRLDRDGPGNLPPFHGVPCSIKESFALTGMPHTAGLVSRKGVTATEDATAVSRLRAAGAIPVGVTNISELCMWLESYNRLYGRSCNPYDPRRIVGGSSGGEGAIIGAGGTPFGLGSDIAGSIRMPAFFNGVFGHKPTGGLVSGWGQFPFAENEARRYVTSGPLARRAEDLWPLMTILAGPDGKDTGCLEFDLGNPDDVELTDVHVLNIPDNGVTPVTGDLRRAQQRAADHLQSRGARVETARIPALKKSLFIWSAMLSKAGGKSYADLMGDGGKINPFWEAVKLAWGGTPFTVPSIALAMLEMIPKYLPDNTNEFVQVGKRLRVEITERLGERGVILYPSYARPAPLHRMPLLRPFEWVYTAVLAVLEFPSTQVPMGLNAQGLPVGIQVVGTHGNDHVPVAVAMELEQAFGGWQPPKGP